MLLKRTLAGLLLLAALPARAGGYEAFAGAWDYAAGGQIEQGGSTISLDDDSGIHTNPQVLALLRYRSDGGWMPDLGAGYVHLGAAGTYLANSTFSIGGIPITRNRTQVGAGVNINDFQASIGWRLYDGHSLRLAAGVGMEYLAGHATFSGTETVSLAGIPLPVPLRQAQLFTVDQWVPMPQLRAEWQPRPWLHFDLSGGYVWEGSQRAGQLRALGEVRLWRQLWLSA